MSDRIDSIIKECEQAMRESLRAPTSEDFERYTTPPRWSTIERILELARSAKAEGSS